MSHPEDEAFNFFFEVFAINGSITEENKDHEVFKNSFIYRLGMQKDPEDVIPTSKSVTIDKAYLIKSVQYMDTAFKKSGFNDAAKFVLIRKEVMAIPDLAQFAIHGGASSYENMRKAVIEYDINHF